MYSKCANFSGYNISRRYSHCGKPVSVCDGSDSDCWLMECGYITCVGECVHEGRNGYLYNPPPLSLVSQWLRAQAPNTRPFIPCGVSKRASVLAYCRLPRNTVVLSSFRSLLTSAFYGLGSKVALSGVAPPSGCSYARLAWGVQS